MKEVNVLTKRLNTLIYGREELKGMKVNFEATRTFRSAKVVEYC